MLQHEQLESLHYFSKLITLFTCNFLLSHFILISYFRNSSLCVFFMDNLWCYFDPGLQFRYLYIIFCLLLCFQEERSTISVHIFTGTPLHCSNFSFSHIYSYLMYSNLNFSICNLVTSSVLFPMDTSCRSSPTL